MIKTLLSNYQTFWKSLTPWARYWPVLLTFSFWTTYLLLGAFNSDHFALGLAILLLAYLGKIPRRILVFLLPLFLTMIVYDSQRFYADILRGRIRVSEPYFFDKNFFGIDTPQGRLTPNEWFQIHTHPFLDVVTGIFYLIFVPLFVLFCAAFEFSKKNLAGRSLAPAAMWSFFWVNVVGYSTYYWYPAAPPWYVTLYGLGPAVLGTPANAAGCARMDQIFGTQFFQEWYGRSQDVFGAIPSLHFSYCLIAVYFAFRFKYLRASALFFYIMMCFSAVYLNHHYVIDVIWGSAYALIGSVILDKYYEKKLNANSTAQQSMKTLHQEYSPPSLLS